MIHKGISTRHSAWCSGDSGSPLLSIEDAAAYANTSDRRWRRMTSECKIEFIKVGRFIRIRKSVIDAYLNENTVKPH
jgi:excisionase family DNA binding protein